MGDQPATIIHLPPVDDTAEFQGKLPIHVCRAVQHVQKGTYSSHEFGNSLLHCRQASLLLNDITAPAATWQPACGTRVSKEEIDKRRSIHNTVEQDNENGKEYIEMRRVLT